jgi:hypothetical protein
MIVEMSAKIYDYALMCKSVMEIDSKIRFAGVVNERGRLVGGGMRENVDPLENEKDDEMLFMELALRVKMRKEFDKQLGCVNFAMALRERALAISVPLGEDILYVVSEPDSDYCNLPKKILEIVKQ